MRGRILAGALSAVLGLTGLALTAGPLEAGVNGPQFGLTVTKEVVGTQTEPGLFEIEVSCEGFINGSGAEVVELADGESETLSVNFGDTCTVTETEDRGATTVTYACDPVEFTTCDADNVVAFDGSDNGGQAAITVTNTFEPAPPPPPEPAPLVVEPSFTG
jgi:hypothetical protein